MLKRQCVSDLQGINWKNLAAYGRTFDKVTTKCLTLVELRALCVTAVQFVRQ